MSFNFASTGAGAGSGGFSFGNQATTTTAASTNPGFSFGTNTVAPPSTNSSGGGFSFGGNAPQQSTTAPPQPTQQQPTGFAFAVKPTVAATNTAQSATPGFSFGTTPTATAATAAPAPKLGGFALAVPNSSTLNANQSQVNPALSGLLSTSNTTTQASTGLAGGFNFGAAPTSSTISSGFTLGGTATSGAQGGIKLGVTNTQAPIATTAGISLGGQPSGAGFTLGGTGTASQPTSQVGQAISLGGGVKPLGTATGTTLTGKPIGQATVTAAVPLPISSAVSSLGASLTTVTNTTASVAPPQTMNYRQLEEQINKWSLELEEQEKIFIQQATQVNAWDRLLIDNGDKIAQLNTDVEKVKLDQQRLDQELDFISAQQKELEELLVPLEQAVEQIPPIHYQQHADLEREHTYKLAENIDAQLKRMVQDLKEIIDHINTSNSIQDNNDPVQQIAKVLNAHMDSLQWIDQNSVLLQRRVDEVAKVSEQRKKEQERNFRLAYD